MPPKLPAARPHSLHGSCWSMSWFLLVHLVVPAGPSRGAGRGTVVPAGGIAVLPWIDDRMGQPATCAAAARHSAGLGARLPVRRLRTRTRAFRVRTGAAKAGAAAC